MNDALALGIPVYCYDRFGGEGYLKEDNIEGSYYYAFCGKYTWKKRTAEELYEDITTNYQNCIKDTKKLVKFAYDNFCFEKMMEKTINKLEKTKKFNLKKMTEKYPHLKRKGILFYNTINLEINELKKYKTPKFFAQIYYDINNGFNEKDSIIQDYKLENNIYVTTFTIPKNTKQLRFDISNQKFTTIKSLKINDKEIKLDKITNCYKIDKNQYMSITDDPYIIFKSNNKTIKVEANIKVLNTLEIITQLNNNPNFIKALTKIKKQRNILKKVIVKLKKMVS